MSRGEARLHVARVELVLARPDHEPLRDVPMKPDPLEGFAQVFEQLRTHRGEAATVAIDLLPASAGQRRRWRNRLREAHDPAPTRAPARRSKSSGSALLDEAMTNRGVGPGAASAMRVGGRRSERRDVQAKLRRDALLGVQVLLRVTSLDPGRPELLVDGLVSCFDVFADANYFRASGLHLGIAFIGSDAPVRAWWFDRRLASGLFRPARRSLVSAREIAGLLKPPTKHCQARNVARAGALISPAPRDLPIYRRQPGVLPFGLVRTLDGERLIGIDRNEFFFGYMSGRSRFGKTELALEQALHVAAIAKDGVAFYDPHSDALERMRPYLTGDGVRERVIELNFARRDLDSRHVAWNLLSMEGYGIGDLADRAQGIIDSFSVAAGWGKGTPRALTIISQAATSLLHLSLQLEPELAPTIFTITRLLSDEHWREIAVSCLPEELQRYWSDVFSTYSADAIGPVANMVTRLGRHPVVRATLGSPKSTYNARRAMDQSKIVLACPGGGRESLLANFIVQDWIQAARSRANIPPDRRRVFHIFLDELQSFDAASSAAGGSSVAELLEQSGKYGVRALALSQSPHRLQDSTVDAIATNASVMGTTANSAEGAAFFHRQWAGLLDAKTAVPRLSRFSYLMQPTHNGRRTEPFLVYGVPVEELYGDLRHPEALPELERAVDDAVRPRTVRQSLAAIEGHDDRIIEEIARRTSRRRAGRPLRAVDTPAPVSAEYQPRGLIVDEGTG